MAKKEKNNEKKTGYSISEPAQTLENKGKFNLESESTKFIVILLCIIVFIAMLWLVDTLKNSKSDNKEEEKATTTINYNEVLVGNMLDQKDDNYLIYAYNKDEANATIDYLLTSATKYYKLNLNLANNKQAVSETSNFKGTVDQIKFKGTTLLLIEKGQISKVYEGEEAIIEYLQGLKK